MTDYSSLVFEPLGKQHDRGAFKCGVDRIDNFFKNNARKQHDRYQVRVFVCRSPESDPVLGFYSLTLASVIPKNVGEEAEKKFERVQAVPVIYLAMIGVAVDHQDKGVGYALMTDAFDRALTIAENAGAYAISLDALDEKVAAKYERYGFERFTIGELSMYLPLSTLREAKNQAQA